MWGVRGAYYYIFFDRGWGAGRRSLRRGGAHQGCTVDALGLYRRLRSEDKTHRELRFRGGRRTGCGLAALRADGGSRSMQHAIAATESGQSLVATKIPAAQVRLVGQQPAAETAGTKRAKRRIVFGYNTSQTRVNRWCARRFRPGEAQTHTTSTYPCVSAREAPAAVLIAGLVAWRKRLHHAHDTGGAAAGAARAASTRARCSELRREP